jgi:hypothetical protein
MKKDDEIEVTNHSDEVIAVQMGTLRMLLLMLPAIIALVGGGMAWGSTSARLDDTEQEIFELQNIVRGQERRLRTQENIESRNEAVFASINESLLDIKRDLRELKENK